jgi:hypothetical protein
MTSVAHRSTADTTETTLYSILKRPWPRSPKARRPHHVATRDCETPRQNRGNPDRPLRRTVRLYLPSATTAKQRDGDSFIINGRKYWPSSPGWDAQGANAQCVIVRTNSEMGGTEGLSAIMGSVARPRCRASHLKEGHRLTANAEVVFDNARMPAANLLPGAQGNGDLVINRNFAWSEPVAATAAVGVARAAYELALDFAKGTSPARSSPSSTSRMSVMSS